MTTPVPDPLRDLALLVSRMRRAQQDYFSSRSSPALHIARDLERRVDRTVAELLGGRQPGLFDGSVQGSSDD